MQSFENGRQAKSQAVLITGASTGIGEATALYLDKQGYRVFAGVRKEKDGEVLRQEASALLTPVIIDVTDRESIARAAAAVTEALGDQGLAGLLNNAGIAVAGPLEFLELDKLQKQLEVNLLGQVAVTQAFLPLIRRGQGRIVFMGSIMGKGVVPFAGPYCATKFALEAIADSLRMELLPWRIPVSIIEPGSISTPFWDRAVETGNEVIDTLPPQGQVLYSSILEKVKKALIYWGKLGTTPDAVVKTAAHALFAAKPKTRYAVGVQAKIWGVFIKLPDRWRDRLLVSGIQTLGKRV